MKNSWIIYYLLLTVTSITAFGQTNVGGTISADATWSLANSPYVVTSSITVNSGITLTVESGVEVKFNSNTELLVYGTLDADGSIFTSNQDTPAPGDWLGLFSGNTNTPAAPVVTLLDCQILYARDGIRASNGNITLTNTSILNSSEDGIYSRNIYLDIETTITADNLTISGTGDGYNGIYGEKTKLILTNSNINTVGQNAVYLNGTIPASTTIIPSTSQITNSTLSDGDYSGLRVENDARVDLSGNTFSNNAFPIRYNSSSSVTFVAENSYTNNEQNVIYLNYSSIDQDMTLDNEIIPYRLSNMSVINGTHLTIQAGALFKFDYTTALSISGKLTAVGTSEAPIIFTSLSDDNVSGDSNNDANDTDANANRWHGILFTSDSDGESIIDYAQIKWANYTSNSAGLICKASSPTLSNITISNSYFGARFEGAANPTFTGNTIGSSTVTPIGMSFEASPTFSNNSFSTSDNQYDAIGLLGGEMTSDGNIIPRNFTDIPNVTYVLLNDITVPVGRTLSIDEGVVIKSLSGFDFIINGKLIVNGTEANPTVFTSVNDDNFGNPLDTRNDGTNAIPAIGDMGGFYFSETSDPTSVINYATIKFGYYYQQYQYSQIFDTDINSHYTWWFYYDAAICVNRSSPTISNTTITDTHVGFDIRGLAEPSLTNNTISNTTKAPIRLAVQSEPVFTNLTFNSVGLKALGILPEVINYTDTLKPRDVAGFENITYYVSALIVNEGARVVFDPGLIIKVEPGTGMAVFGGLKINGTAEAPVTFTALADDNTGNSPNVTDNDTQSNGNATDPNTSEWRDIVFHAASDDTFSSIDHAVFKYGGQYSAPVVWKNASASLSNSAIEFSESYGIYLENNSNPQITGVTIRTSRLDPIGMSYFADPTFTDITFDTNGSNGIRLIDGTLSANASIRKRSLAGINNIAYIMAELTINSGATLTINPGVVIKKVNGSGITVNEGAINAQGTSTEKIIFTSTQDDSRGGDTNIDGNGSSPAAGNWTGFYFAQSSMQSILNHCEIRYAGSTLLYNVDKYGTIISENNNLLVENSLVQLSTSNAFAAYGTSTATFRNNRLENIASFPVHLSMFASPTFEGNTVENIRYMAIGVREETFTQSATFPFRSFAGIDSITYMPTYYYGRGFIVSSGTKITVPAGMIFKHNNHNLFDVSGELHLAGTEEDPIIITRVEDDDYGRPLDTENNGPFSNLTRANQGIAIFRNVSTDASIVENVLFRYGVHALTLESASPMIRNNTFEKSYEGINSSGISEPFIIGNTFRDLEFAPFTTSLVAYPIETTGNILEGTTYKAIRINSETLTQDTTLYKRSFAGITNIPYLFTAYTVGLGVKMTIEPGVILKFSDTYRLYDYPSGVFTVNGALEARGGGNSDSTIVFTTESDDFYGGDTNGDGNNEQPRHGFGGLVFANESSDSESILENVIFRYAANNAVTLNSASPTISNCNFVMNGFYYGGGAMYLTGASNPILSGNDFLDNNSGGINNTGSFTVDATGSWWGHNSGPYEATLNPNGQGDAVQGAVTFDPWATDNMQNPITGDVSLNGVVSAYDAALTLQDVAAIITFEARQDRAGDVSGDGNVSAMDASYILQYAAGLIRWFPAEAENKRINEQWVSTSSAIEVALGEAELQEGMQMIEIPMTVHNVQDLYAFESVIQLDDELEFVEFRQMGWNQVQMTTHFIATNNEFRMAFAQMNGLQEDTQLGVLVVKPKSILTKPSLALTLSKVVGNETDVTGLATSGRVQVAADILSVAKDQLFTIYPNPAASFVDITLPKTGDYSISVTDLNGKEQFKQAVSNTASFRIDLNALRLRNGIYLIRINAEDVSIEHKLIINK